MMKKILALSLTVIFGVFTLFGCSNSSLEKYKTSKITELHYYADSKGIENYSQTSWIMICDAVIEGEQTINDATNKAEVTVAFKDAKRAVDEVLSEEYAILNEFDLTDPKSTWFGSIDDEFTDNLVIITLRKTLTYPELDLSYFKLANSISLKYSGGVRPPDYFFAQGNEELLENFRQIVFIYLHPQGKEKIIEAIRALEKLVFIRSVEPNILLYPC